MRGRAICEVEEEAGFTIFGNKCPFANGFCCCNDEGDEWRGGWWMIVWKIILCTQRDEIDRRARRESRRKMRMEEFV